MQQKNHLWLQSTCCPIQYTITVPENLAATCGDDSPSKTTWEHIDPNPDKEKRTEKTTK